MRITQRKMMGVVGLVVVTALGVVFGWYKYFRNNQDAGVTSGNGRIEAVEIDVAAKSAGRVKDILVREGDFVTAGQVVAVMDTETLEAELWQAKAQLQQARSVVATSQSQLAQRQSEKAAALAMVSQREVELVKARQHARRSAELVQNRAIAKQDADDDAALLRSAEAALHAAQAQSSAVDSTIMAARTQIGGAQAAVEAARANVERIQAELRDSTLKSPRDGRVQYKVAQLGEVVGAGGRVLSLVDLSDVYMTFFLPTTEAGKLAMGSEVRLVLDAAPQYVIPARVSFVADVAQFTPKTVETASEREKLMFRVRAQIPPELLKKHITRVKTGLPGVAWVRLDATKPWPARLQIKLPQ
ncbi:HlyD family efflux transporter periplasmic adaptor subunit [Trichlorobacter lovleyi]|uniref:HlyD family secretion protein n=1 Tax=Trichlorobacter lovleyi TaxID=313985 RepID=UPI00223F41E7|nr:HlyD family efflux transporter periplasmic adaptor subunit [Trichlorobacter lovleyi]QOX80389.1 HlyD family efflux transporter periplasmic adaptor subunit [Trichlorobacter lovleyi]